MNYELLDYAGGAPETTLAADITSGATTFAVSSGTGTNFPDGDTGPFYVIVDYDNTKAEKIRCLSRSGDTFTVPGTNGRGVDGTTAVTHASGAKVRHVFTATEAQEANRTAHYTLGQVTAKGDLLVGTGANTLDNVPVGSNNALLVADSAQSTGVKWAGALPAGTLVGTTDTQTLTNKTLTNPAINGGTLDAASTHGGVTGTQLAAAFGTWTSYTPTFTNCTSPTGTFRYMVLGKTMFLYWNFTGGTVTNGSLATGFTLPGSYTVSNPQAFRIDGAAANIGISNTGAANVVATSTSTSSGTLLLIHLSKGCIVFEVA